MYMEVGEGGGGRKVNIWSCSPIPKLLCGTPAKRPAYKVRPILFEPRIGLNLNKTRGCDIDISDPRVRCRRSHGATRSHRL